MALRRSTALRPAAEVLLVLASVAAVVAVGCGVLLARSTGSAGALLDRHRLFGFATAVLVIVALVLHHWSLGSDARWTRAGYRVGLAGSFAAMTIAGYYGGVLAHGENTPFVVLAQ